MVKNYLQIAWRQMLRHKGYTMLNVLGLAVGVACALGIFTYVRQELSYDSWLAQSVGQERASRIYRLAKERIDDKPTRVVVKTGESSGAMAAGLVANIPEVKNATRYALFDGLSMVVGDKIMPIDAAFADSNYFDFFGRKLLQGDANQALRAPGSMVLTPAGALKLFGSVEVMGKTVMVAGRYAFTITGIVEPMPLTSHQQYEAIISWSSSRPGGNYFQFGGWHNWRAQGMTTYLEAAPNATLAGLGPKVDELLKIHLPDRVASYEFYAQPWNEIYLWSADFNGNPLLAGNGNLVITFAWIGVFLLVIACVNYVNLQTARATRRAHEVGVRKTIGANRQQLIFQFLTEGVLVAAVSVFIGLVLYEVTLPWFNTAFNRQLPSIFGNLIAVSGISVALIALIGLSAGFYPALVLSGFDPIQVLKGKGGSRMSRIPRYVLTTFQYTMAIALIAGTIVIYQQVNYAMTKDRGVQTARVVRLVNTRDIAQHLETFRAQLLAHPGIEKVVFSDAAPGDGTWSNFLRAEGASPTDDRELRHYGIGADFNDAYKVPLVAGRFFLAGSKTDSLQSILLNETAVQAFGWTPEIAIGKRITDSRPEQAPEWLTVVGVLKDFHTQGVKQAIEPTSFHLDQVDGLTSIVLNPEHVPAALAHIEKVWGKYKLQRPFEYQFVDDLYARYYEDDRRLFSLIRLFAGIAILIASLGLYGLVAYTIEQRAKEMGIRKVLGAGLLHIALLINRSFVWPMVLGLALAIPAVWYYMQQWLGTFAYHIDLSVWPFAIAALLVLFISLLAVGGLSLRAATANPVNALRSE